MSACHRGAPARKPGLQYRKKAAGHEGNLCRKIKVGKGGEGLYGAAFLWAYMQINCI